MWFQCLLACCNATIYTIITHNFFPPSFCLFRLFVCSHVTPNAIICRVWFSSICVYLNCTYIFFLFTFCLKWFGDSLVNTFFRMLFDIVPPKLTLFWASVFTCKQLSGVFSIWTRRTEPLSWIDLVLNVNKRAHIHAKECAIGMRFASDWKKFFRTFQSCKFVIIAHRLFIYAEQFKLAIKQRTWNNQWKETTGQKNNNQR